LVGKKYIFFLPAGLLRYKVFIQVLKTSFSKPLLENIWDIFKQSNGKKLRFFLLVLFRGKATAFASEASRRLASLEKMRKKKFHSICVAKQYEQQEKISLFLFFC
jgi:hypothetical protein